MRGLRSRKPIGFRQWVVHEKLLSILHLYAEPKKETEAAVKKMRIHGIKIGSTTGYTDKMMEIIVPLAKEKGYTPDTWFSPDSTNNVGRPYPYMIFQFMAAGADKVFLTLTELADFVVEG